MSLPQDEGLSSIPLANVYVIVFSLRKCIVLFFITSKLICKHVFYSRKVQFESILNENSSDEEEEFNDQNVRTLQSDTAVQEQHSSCNSAMQIDNSTDRDEVNI